MTIRVGLAALVGALALAGCAVTTAAGPPRVGSPSVVTSAPRSTSEPVVPAARPVAAVKPRPRPNPCATSTHAQLVRVSLRAQHLWMCAHRRLVADTPITSGMLGQYTETPTGTFRIQGITRDTSLTLISGATYAVKYWIPFDGPLFGFHDSSWQNFPYGSARYRTDGSHGCVHMPLRAIAFLARWAEVGATVTIAA